MPSLIDDIDKVNLTLQELWEFLYYDEDIPVTLRQLQQAVRDEELVATKLSNNNRFSKRDGLDWLAAQKGKRRAVAGQGKRRLAAKAVAAK